MIFVLEGVVYPGKITDIVVEGVCDVLDFMGGGIGQAVEAECGVAYGLEVRAADIVPGLEIRIPGVYEGGVYVCSTKSRV